MNVFFSRNISGDTVILDEAESRHAASVLRVITGESALVLDGAGTVFETIFVEVHPKHCHLQIKNRKSFEKRKVSFHIAIAPTKMNDRMEWFLEKATEVGVEQITPIICDRSERRVVNLERFRKVVLAATKQSKQPWLPELHEAISFEHFTKSQSPGFIAHCIPDKKRQPISDAIRETVSITVMVGPEGDFTPHEVDKAIQTGWKSVSLGDSRLRTETAGLVACVAVKLVMGHES